MDLGVKHGSRFESRKIRVSKKQDAPRRLSAGLAFSRGGHNGVGPVKRLET
jgi:hypothetical protein